MGGRVKGAPLLRRLFRGLLGVLWGLLAGFVITLGLVVARARIEDVYIHDFSELRGWLSLPMVLLPLLGAWLGASERQRLGPPALGSLAGLLAGTGLGAAAGAVLSADPAWTWAGGVLGATLGLLVGAVGAVIRDLRSGGGRTTAAASAAFLLLVVGGACRDEPPALPPPGQHEEPSAGAVESVLYLIGDAGQARRPSWPAVEAAHRDVERWAGRLGPDGNVAVVFLGDIVYPDGVSARDAERWAVDSARVASQVYIVSGPQARRHDARAFFVAGNHDWGQEQEWSGAVRLHRLDSLLARWNERGVNVTLEPEAGTGGPAVVDIGEHLRLVLLDTAWWLYDGEPPELDEVMLGVERALTEAAGRRTVLAAHHPLRSGGPHGALDTFGSTLGLRTLLARSGALLQDLHSEPYRELLLRMQAVFREHGPPDVFAGGHEHSLQVIRRARPSDPRVNLVSGSASKLTNVEFVDGTVFAASAPGYIRLFVMEDGSLRLSVEAAPPRFLQCTGEGAELERCMEEGVGAYRTVWTGDI